MQTTDKIVVVAAICSDHPGKRRVSGTTSGLSCGNLVSGSIITAGQTDKYTFQATAANEILTLTLVDTGGFASGTAVVSLIAPSGQVLTSFGANNQAQVPLPATGTYGIQVVGSGFTAIGQYNLGLDCRKPTAPVKAALGCGALAHGSLTALGQVDQYTFQATAANEILTLTLVDTGGFASGPAAVSLFAPSGQALVTFLAANGQVQVPLPAAGTYVLQVVGSGFTATGQYNLGLECRNPTAPVKAVLGCGALAHGSLTALGQVDQYTFQATAANEILTLTLVDTGGFASGPAAVSLFAPSGQALVTFLAANGQQQVPLPVAGTYVLQVVGSGFTATGQYNLGLDCRNPTAPVKAVLGCGALAHGSLTALGQVDQYTFQATAANEILTLTLVDTGGFASGLAAVSLFAPSGQALVTFLAANGQQQVPLPVAGTYVLQVVGSGFTATGQYNLGLDCRNPTAPVKAVLGCGALVPGSLTALGQVDQYTFQATAANEILTLTLVDTGGFASGPAAVSLFAPSGQALVTFLAANGQQQVPLPVAGTYVLQVVGSSFTATGQYNLGLDCRNPTAPVKAVLGCGALAHGSLTALGQLDQYAFQAQAHQIVTLTLVDTGGFASGPAAVSLFAPSGQALVTFLAANGQQQVPLPVAGTYVLQVVGSGFTATGQYNVNWQFTTGCPICTLSPTSLTFATQLVGTTSTAKTVTATNTGKATMTITAISFTGADRTDFQQTHTCGTSLAVGAKCTFSVSFKPTAMGTRTADVSIADNAAPPNPQTVPLAGTGTVVKLVPTSLGFGDQTVGTTSAAKTVTMTNVGTTTLTINGISLTGTNAGDFSQTHTCGSTLGAGASCTVSVEFKPATAGALKASLSIADNATGSPQAVALTGTGRAPAVTLTPTSLAFASTVVGSTTAAQFVTIKNSGTATLNLTSETITGTNPTSFIKSATTCGTTLAAAASCTVSVEFKPAATGALKASLSIADNATGSPQAVALTGTGTAPAVTLTPTSLAFASTVVGTTTAAKVVTIKNSGTATLNLTSETITGTNPTSFIKSATTCGTTLAVAASCTVSVEFKPAVTGALKASLSIADNATGSPQAVTLTGTGN